MPAFSFHQGLRSACRHQWAKGLLFCLYGLPLASLAIGIWQETLGANPAEFLIRATGDWTLRALCLVMAVTPMRIVFGLPELARFRRMAGVFTWFYASLHLLCYSWFDMDWSLVDIALDLAKRPFILVGFAAWLILLTLGATSFNAAIRWMGARRWQALHRSAYVAAVLGVLHFFWMRAAKQNFVEVAVYALILSALLGWRAWRAWWRPA